MNVSPSLIVMLAAAAWSTGCGVSGHTDPALGTPPPAQVQHEGDDSVVAVQHPERFPLATAVDQALAPELRATGVVSPDVSRAVPVVSLASGRVVELHARLGDTVRKGQLLLRIQSADVASAFAAYQKAVADQGLAEQQLDRAKDLFGRGAIARKDLEVSQDTAEKAAVDVDAARQQLRVLGVDTSRPPSGVVDITAPVSGVITEQNVTEAGGVRSLDSSPNLFTISDLSHVWILCDVHENDLAAVRLGETADIHVAAYPNDAITGRISNIGAILDPATRTAKVRVEVANAGLLRIGMFVTAVFHGLRAEQHVVVPASAVLHLHDRDWVYLPAAQGRFERRPVVSGRSLPGNMQEIVSGLATGDQIVSNALVLESSAE